MKTTEPKGHEATSKGAMTTTTSSLLFAWVRAHTRLHDYQAHVRQAEKDLKKAMDELGRHLMPHDAERGDEFAIWVNYEKRDRLLIVRMKAENEGDGFDVRFR